MPLRVVCFALSIVLLVPLRPLASQAADTTRRGQPAGGCPSCAEWNAPQRPFRIYGNTYYVGTRGLSALLVTSSDGHVLVDAGLPESAPSIAANVRALGFRVEDIEMILISHAHFDHAGGVAALQRASGAVVAASPRSASVLRRGRSGPDDPQYGVSLPFPPVPVVTEIADRDPVRMGSLTLTPHFTPGHTPGGTSWSWRSCEAGRCLDLVYADSQTPVSADGFYFTRSQTYPSALEDFARGLARLDQLPCDVLLTPHPGFSDLFERIAARDRGGATALADRGACRRYVTAARQRLARRVETETGTP